jgi:hypothetical protein
MSILLPVGGQATLGSSDSCFQKFGLWGIAILTLAQT